MYDMYNINKDWNKIENVHREYKYTLCADPYTEQSIP